MDCNCLQCQAACQRKPGWFAPGEAERVGVYLGMSLPELFQHYLMVDWFERTNANPIFVLSPAIKGHTAGSEFPANPQGECVFYENGQCRIHPVKPEECRGVMACKSQHGPPWPLRLAIRWNSATDQRQIRQLLTREPKTSILK